MRRRAWRGAWRAEAKAASSSGTAFLGQAPQPDAEPITGSQRMSEKVPKTPRTGTAATSKRCGLLRFLWEGKQLQIAEWPPPPNSRRGGECHSQLPLQPQSMSHQRSVQRRSLPQKFPMPVLDFCFKATKTEIRKQSTWFCIILIIARIMATTCQALPMVNSLQT